jgi:hypothetical protein
VNNEIIDAMNVLGKIGAEKLLEKYQSLAVQESDVSGTISPKGIVI